MNHLHHRIPESVEFHNKKKQEPKVEKEDSESSDEPVVEKKEEAKTEEMDYSALNDKLH